jgi:hypothetical protein
MLLNELILFEETKVNKKLVEKSNDDESVVVKYAESVVEINEAERF